MKNVLVIDAPRGFFDFLKAKFATEDVSVTDADCNRDAFMKMMSTLSDLVILDMQRGFEDILNLLKQKRSNPNTQRMPVIAIGPVLDKTQTAMFAQFGVVKYFTRPLEADVFFNAAAQAMGIDVSIDPTPGHFDIRRCGDMIFIDASGSLNRDKISVLNMDMVDLVQGITAPKVVCLMNALQVSFLDAVNLEYLFDGILSCPKVQSKNVKVIVDNPFVTELLDGHKRYENIEVASNIAAVANALVDTSSAADLKTVIAERMLHVDPTAPTLTMGTVFSTDTQGTDALSDAGNIMRIAIADADDAIRGALVREFNMAGATCDEFLHGADLQKAAEEKHYDLIIIDVHLPDGKALQAVRQLTYGDVPVVVHSVPQGKEEVKSVLSLGVRRYFAKPLNKEAWQGGAHILVQKAIALIAQK